MRHVVIRSMIDDYLTFAEICDNTDYENEKNIRKRNIAVSKMYDIVVSANENPNDLSELVKLLKHPKCSVWLAHQLIEKASITKEIEDECFEIIQNIAVGDSADAMGERFWLEEWKQKKGRL